VSALCTETASGAQAVREFGVTKLLSSLPLSLPEDVAYPVIRGAVLRQRSVYYPHYFAKVYPIVYQFIPSYFEKYAATFYKRD